MVDSAKLTRVYLKMRQARADLERDHKARVAEIEDQMKTVENLMLGTLLDLKAESMKTTAGTFFLETTIKPSCHDWGAYYGWMAQEGAFEGLEKRVARNFIGGYMKDHDNATPPGISVYREKVVRVRVGNE